MFPYLAPVFVLITTVTLLLVSKTKGSTDSALRITRSADQLSFVLHGGGETTDSQRWMLQFSTDGKTWTNLQAFDVDANNGTHHAKLAWENTLTHTMRLFRAAQVDTDALSVARAKWRASGLDHYRYELRWQWSFFSWHGTVTVENGEVTASQTILALPEFIEDPPGLLTIDDWFDKVSSAQERDVEILEVTWHPDYGYPATGFIDESQLIADEEQSWQILGITDLSP